MKANLTNDKWFTTVDSAFVANSDGVKRTELDPEFVRTAFDFDIAKYPNFTENGKQIPGQFHLRRTDDDEIIPSRAIGMEYKPIQHREIYDYIVKEIQPQIKGMKLECVGTMHGGGTGIVSAILGEPYGFKGDKSPHETRLFFCNPCNGKGSLVLGETTVRLFCQNQIPAAIRSSGQNGIHVFHTTNADIKIEHAKDVVYAQLQEVYNLRDREEALTHLGVDISDVDRILNRLFPLNRFEEGSVGYTRMNNQREEVIRQFETGETAETFSEKNGLCLFNSITHEIYNPRSIGKGTDLAQIRFSGTMGSRAARVRKVLSVVEEELQAA